jgi:hypothetical protein
MAKIKSSGPPRPPLSLAEAKKAMEAAVSKATAERIDVALGGGFAMQTYGSSRLTKDVDLLASRLPAFAKKGKLINIGGRTIDLDGVPIDFIVRGDEYADLYDAAIATAKKTAGLAVRVVRPEYMVALKMVAARPKDTVDLDFLLSSVKLDARLLKSVVHEYLGRYAVTDLKNRAQTAKWLKSQGRLD